MDGRKNDVFISVEPAGEGVWVLWRRRTGPIHLICGVRGMARSGDHAMALCCSDCQERRSRKVELEALATAWRLEMKEHPRGSPEHASLTGSKAMEEQQQGSEKFFASPA